jgi:hypothetical protein
LMVGTSFTEVNKERGRSERRESGRGAMVADVVVYEEECVRSEAGTSRSSSSARNVVAVQCSAVVRGSLVRVGDRIDVGSDVPEPQ